MNEQLYKVILEYHLKAHKVTKFSKPVYMPESLYNMLRSNLKSGCDVTYLLDGITVYLADMYIEKKMRSALDDGRI